MQTEIWRIQNYDLKTMMHSVKKAWCYSGGIHLTHMWLPSGASVVSDINNPCVFHAAWMSTPYLHWDGRLKDLLAWCPLNLACCPQGLSLASLVLCLLCLSLFKSSLMLFQWALLTSAQRSFSPFETGVSHLLPAGLVSCTPTHDQKNPKILLVTPGLEPAIDLLPLPVSSLVISCNRKDRGEP